MKLVFALLFTLSLSLFLGCKKGTNESINYYMNMEIDGKSFSFIDSLSATKSPVGGELTIFSKSKTNGQDRLFFSGSTAGTYLNSYDTTVKKRIYEFTVNEIVSYSNNTPVFRQLLRPNPSVPNNISATITNVNSTYVEGTFSGSLSDGSGLATISNGQFR